MNPCDLYDATSAGLGQLAEVKVVIGFGVWVARLMVVSGRQVKPQIHACLLAEAGDLFDDIAASMLLGRGFDGVIGGFGVAHAGSLGGCDPLPGDEAEGIKAAGLRVPLLHSLALKVMMPMW